MSPDHAITWRPTDQLAAPTDLIGKVVPATPWRRGTPLPERRGLVVDVRYGHTAIVWFPTMGLPEPAVTAHAYDITSLKRYADPTDMSPTWLTRAERRAPVDADIYERLRRRLRDARLERTTAVPDTEQAEVDQEEDDQEEDRRARPDPDLLELAPGYRSVETTTLSAALVALQAWRATTRQAIDVLRTSVASLEAAKFAPAITVPLHEAIDAFETVLAALGKTRDALEPSERIGLAWNIHPDAGSKAYVTDDRSGRRPA